MGSDTAPTKKKKKVVEAKTQAAGCCSTMEGQLNQLQQQLSAQQAQIKDQQDKIQNLQQQLQQGTTQAGSQNQAMEDQIRQANQKAAAAQDAAAAANANASEVKTETVTISKSLKESQISLDKLLNPEKYLPKPTVVQAVAPVRVLPVNPPKRDGLVPAFRIGAIRVTPYGFLKMTVVNDTSDPNGDDFPFPGIFLSTGPGLTQAFNAGPSGSPEFHIKARSTRFGSNFEWPDMSRDLIPHRSR